MTVPDLSEYGLSSDGLKNADAWEKCIAENKEFTITSDIEIPMGRNIELLAARTIRAVGGTVIVMEDDCYFGWDGEGKTGPLKDVVLYVHIKGKLRANDRPIFFIKSDRSNKGVLNANPVGADCYDFNFDVRITGSNKTGQGAVILGAYAGTIGLKVQQTNTAMILDRGPRTSYGMNGVGFSHFELQGNYRAGWIRDFQAVKFPSKAIIQGHNHGIEIIGPGRGLRLPTYFEVNAKLAQSWANIPVAHEVPGTIFSAPRLSDGTLTEYQFPHDFTGSKGEVWDHKEEARYVKLKSASISDKFDIQISADAAADTPTNIVLPVYSSFSARAADKVPHAIHLVRGRGLDLSGSFEGYSSNPISNKSTAPEDIQGIAQMIYGKYDNPWNVSQLPAIDLETARFYEKERVKGQIVISSGTSAAGLNTLATFDIPSIGFNQTAIPVKIVVYGRLRAKGVNKLLQVAMNRIVLDKLSWNTVAADQGFEFEVIIIPISNAEQTVVGKLTGFGGDEPVVQSQTSSINTLRDQIRLAVVGSCSTINGLFLDTLTWDKGHR